MPCHFIPILVVKHLLLCHNDKTKVYEISYIYILLDTSIFDILFFFKLNATGKVCHPTVSVFVMYISDMCSAEFWRTHLTPHERAERVRVKWKGDCWKFLNCLHKCMEEGRLCPTILATAQLLVVCPGLIKASLHISGCKDLCFMTQRESFISLFLCPAAEAALWMWQPGSYHISFQGLLLMTQAFPVTVNQIQNRTRI